MSAGETFRSDRDRSGLFRASSDNNCPRDARASSFRKSNGGVQKTLPRPSLRSLGCTVFVVLSNRQASASLRRSGLHDHPPTIQGGMVAE